MEPKKRLGAQPATGVDNNPIASACSLVLRQTIGLLALILAATQPGCTPAPAVMPGLASATLRPAATSPVAPRPALALPTGTSSLDRQPHFEPGECWGEPPRGAEAMCGYLIVPENRSQPPRGGNSIRLAVMILRIENLQYTQAPTFLLGGRPGQDVIAMFVDLFQKYTWILDHGFPTERFVGELKDAQEFKAVMDIFVADLQRREFILFDQRGAGYSQPSLKCHREDWQVCHSRLVSAGVDLASYNTLENAADVSDLQTALGYPQINLYSGSYGTRLALEVMRRNPEMVRAVVLDGVLPAQVNWAAEMTRRYDDALQALFGHCRADPACNAAYPDLETVFYSLVERLNARPIEVQLGEHTLILDGDDLRDAVWNGLYDRSTIRYLPALINHLDRGNPDLLVELLKLKAEEASKEWMAWGMTHSVECSEGYAFETPQEIVRAAENLPPAIQEGVIKYFGYHFPICEVWAVPTAPAAVHTPVQSDLPTLLLSGELDPVTPPAFAKMASQTLRDHYSYVFPGLGHTDGFTNSCYWSLISAFLENPFEEPDTACMAQVTDPEFVIPEVEIEE